MPHGMSGGQGPSRGPGLAKKGTGGAYHAPSKTVENVAADSDPLVISNSSPEIMCPELFDACRVGKVNRVRQLLSHPGVSVTATDYYGKTCFHTACFAGHEKVVEALLEEHPPLLSQNTDDGTTPLMSACSLGQLRIVRLLLDRQVDPHDTAADGTTPLMKASEKGSVECIDFLLRDCKANVNARTEEGWTALLHAAKKGRAAAVKSLLDWQADPLAKLRDGTSASELARDEGHDSTVRALEMHAKLQARKAGKANQAEPSTPAVAQEEDARCIEDIMAEFEEDNQALTVSKKKKKRKGKSAVDAEELLAAAAGLTADEPADDLPPVAKQDKESEALFIPEESIASLAMSCRVSDEASAAKVDDLWKELGVQGIKHVM
eukprot:TRINITY_DN11655_c0_g1_i1.p1 TRINITY_DN11655_c0_g1~~TRINITY_DN11655_c0_g1_i1.p1  ORF type:complete len:378 (+),score=100.34 TRINITY_DN11655_c0_g1_i1:41-1174(+)